MHGPVVDVTDDREPELGDALPPADVGARSLGAGLALRSSLRGASELLYPSDEMLRRSLGKDGHAQMLIRACTALLGG